MNKRTTEGIITITGACILVLLSVFVVPFILSSPPENRTLETIENENIYPSEVIEGIYETEQHLDLSHLMSQPDQNSREVETINICNRSSVKTAGVETDINAIPIRMAIAIADEVILSRSEFTYSLYEEPPHPFSRVWRGSFGGGHSYGATPLGVRYIEPVDHLSAPIWQVLFSEHISGNAHIKIPEESTPVEHRIFLLENDNCTQCEILLFDETDEEGSFIRRKYTYEVLIVIDINAFTGDFINKGEINFCDHDTGLRIFSTGGKTDQNLVDEYVQNWVLFQESDLPIPAPVSMPISESFQQNPGVGASRVRVPDLVGRGRTQEEVVTALTEIGLLVNICPAYANLTEGTIVKISDVREIVPAGTTIDIHVIAGSEPS